MPGENSMNTFDTLPEFNEVARLLRKINKKGDTLLRAAKGNTASLEYRKGDFFKNLHDNCSIAIDEFNERFSKMDTKGSDLLFCAHILLKIELFLAYLRFNARSPLKKVRTSAGAISALFKVTMFAVKEKTNQLITGQHLSEAAVEDAISSRCSESWALLKKFGSAVGPENYVIGIILVLMIAADQLKEMALPLADAIPGCDLSRLISDFEERAPRVTGMERFFLNEIAASTPQNCDLPLDWRTSMVQFSRWHCQVHDNYVWLIIPLPQGLCFKIEMSGCLNPEELEIITEGGVTNTVLLFTPALKAILLKIIEMNKTHELESEICHVAGPSSSR